MGFYDRYWEMKKGGPYEADAEIFKCKDCGAETYPSHGWNGEPDPGCCRHGCQSRESDWKLGRVSEQYRKNFDRVFPNAPGAGL